MHPAFVHAADVKKQDVTPPPDAPDWDRLGLKGLDRLPALQWKLQNVRSMAPDKHRQAVEKLARILSA